MSEDRKKHTIWLRDGDCDFIGSIFNPHGVSTAHVIRSLVSNFVDAKREEMKNEATLQDAEDIEVEVKL